MVRLDPHAPLLRDRADVRARVDQKLEDAQSHADVRAQLDAPERVEWLLGELLVCLRDRRFHIWVQGFALGEDPARDLDGPRVIAGIAEAARELDPLVAELLRWTAWRGVHRRGGLFTVVPEVWLGAWHHVAPFVDSVVGRWPDDVDPFAFGEPGPWSRATVEPARSEPRYPGVRVGFTADAKDCALRAEPNPDSVIETVAHALWKGGASEDELDDFFSALGGVQRELPAVVARWISFDGDGGDAARLEAYARVLFPTHPLAAELGLDELPRDLSLARVPAARLEPLAEALRETATVYLQPGTDRPFASCVRAALRMDRDVLLAAARDVDDAGAEVLEVAAQTGHIVAIAGESPAVDRLEARLRATGGAVLRAPTRG